jgi:hypothetical protein
MSALKKKNPEPADSPAAPADTGGVAMAVVAAGEEKDEAEEELLVHVKTLTAGLVCVPVPQY